MQEYAGQMEGGEEREGEGHTVGNSTVPASFSHTLLSHTSFEGEGTEVRALLVFRFKKNTVSRY
jgi:hypothetical protein